MTMVENLRRIARIVRVLSVPHLEIRGESANAGSGFRMGSRRFVVLRVWIRFHGRFP